jgi:hypothetical protein
METTKDALSFYEEYIKDAESVDINFYFPSTVTATFNKKNGSTFGCSLSTVQNIHDRLYQSEHAGTIYPKELRTALKGHDTIIAAIAESAKNSNGVTHTQKFNFPIQ